MTLSLEPRAVRRTLRLALAENKNTPSRSREGVSGGDATVEKERGNPSWWLPLSGVPKRWGFALVESSRTLDAFHKLGRALPDLPATRGS